MPLIIDWDLLMATEDSFSDDIPPEIVITPSNNQTTDDDDDVTDFDFQNQTVDQLKSRISSFDKSISATAHKLSDNGEKLRAKRRRYAAELERRNCIRRNHKVKGGGIKFEETMHLSDRSDEGASYRKEKRDQKSFASQRFSKLLDGNQKCSRTGNAFQEELFYFKPGQGRNMKPASQSLSRRWSSQQTSSKTKPFHWPNTPLFDTGKRRTSNDDEKLSRSSTSCHQSVERKWDLFIQPSTYSLVDDDEPLLSETPFEKLSDCMKDVKVYYPSRDDQDSVEVNYSNMDSIASKAWLSSNIMNFYIRYLQQLTSSSENATCKYHFFNTYFYNKLKKLNNSEEDSFLKLRKWWKHVNIFEKAYIFLPIHESGHWSLAIICIPAKSDDLGPVVLHLDSLALHNSYSIFDNVRSFLKGEWMYLQNSEDPFELPIASEIWENLDCKIIDREIQVPRQRNAYDCGLFVLFYMERFIKEAPERLKEQDLSMFTKQWFNPEEASSLRGKIKNILVKEFKLAKQKETTSSPSPNR
ncbi:ubiquitin-like-specific protease 1C [Rutidosis leptorrhynchoides]|uniref:ubiquitin-like-specific protease 1C n=1 Tax=Rutidosis leptorrhynchoides TaxID=125765 RepID=UPI003A9954FF